MIKTCAWQTSGFKSKYQKIFNAGGQKNWFSACGEKILKVRYHMLWMMDVKVISQNLQCILVVDLHKSIVRKKHTI